MSVYLYIIESRAKNQESRVRNQEPKTWIKEQRTKTKDNIVNEQSVNL